MYQAISSVIRLADKMTKTLTLAGSLPRLLMVIPGGGGRGILTLILLWVMEELTEGHVATLLVLVIKVTPGDVAAGVHGVHALIGPDKPILASGHPFQFLEHFNLDKSDGGADCNNGYLVLKIKMNLRRLMVMRMLSIQSKKMVGVSLRPMVKEGRLGSLLP